MKEKQHYYAVAVNSQGCCDVVGHSNSISGLSKLARNHYGSGWKIIIYRKEINGEPTTVKTFTIR